MQIFIKTLQGKSITMDVDENMKVSDLKQKISEKEGVPTDQQRLVFHGKQLEDDNLLKDYDVRADDNIHLVLRLR